MLGKQSAPWASALLWSFLRLLSEWALLCECWEEAHLWSLRSLWELELAHEFYALFSSSTEKKQQKTVDSGTCSLSPKVVPRYTELCPLQTVDWLTNLPPQVLLGITLPLLRNDGTVRPQHDLRLSLPQLNHHKPDKIYNFPGLTFSYPPIVVQLLSCVKKISRFLTAGNESREGELSYPSTFRLCSSILTLWTVDSDCCPALWPSQGPNIFQGFSCHLANPVLSFTLSLSSRVWKHTFNTQLSLPLPIAMSAWLHSSFPSVALGAEYYVGVYFPASTDNF